MSTADTKNNMIKASIIIPCRNEEKNIAQCLDSLIAQDFSKDSMEILVVNGMSTDATHEIVTCYIETHPWIKLLENKRKIIPIAMNIGIAHAQGEIIIKIDAHSVYKEDYVSKCVEYIKSAGVSNVGGILRTLAPNLSSSAQAIAHTMMHPFGVGNSYFRRADIVASRESDTVAFGCFKKSLFNEIGYYNEKLIRSSDMELNKRIKKYGGKIMIFPDIIGYYYTDPNFFLFWKHNFKDGFWAIYPIKSGYYFNLRHFLPFLFLLTLLLLLFLSLFYQFFLLLFSIIVFLYIGTSLLFSFIQALKHNTFPLIFFLPIAFAIRHFGYGIGSLIGFFAIFLKK